MNDPWNSLIDGLCGRPCPTPGAWAQRRIHRMCDDQPTVLAPPAQRRIAPLVSAKLRPHEPSPDHDPRRHGR
jgi:hypothetical protein